MNNKELIKHIRAEAAKSTDEAFDLWMRVLKSLQDAEDLLNEASEVAKGVIDKQAEEINRLKERRKELVNKNNSLLQKHRNYEKKRRKDQSEINRLKAELNQAVYQRERAKDDRNKAETRAEELKAKLSEQVDQKGKVCKHSRIEEIQGGQIERCRDCGKQWG